MKRKSWSLCMFNFKLIDLLIKFLIIAFDHLNLATNCAIKHVKLLVKAK
jgi:hypothetical protein